MFSPYLDTGLVVVVFCLDRTAGSGGRARRSEAQDASVEEALLVRTAQTVVAEVLAVLLLVRAALHVDAARLCAFTSVFRTEHSEASA